MIVLGNQGNITLSKQQYRLMCYLRRGLSIKDAAAGMGIVPRTAYYYYEEVKNKMGTNSLEETISEFDRVYGDTFYWGLAVLHRIWGEDDFNMVMEFMAENGIECPTEQEELAYVTEKSQNLIRNEYFTTCFAVALSAILMFSSNQVARAQTPTPVPYGTPFCTPTPMPVFEPVLAGFAIFNSVTLLMAAGLMVIIAVVIGRFIAGRVRWVAPKIWRKR